MKPQDLKRATVGVFDSGVGGLTVLKAIGDQLPHENLIYIGDTAHCPYGSKPRQTITNHALSIASFLINQGVKLLVPACNTIVSTSFDQLQQEFNLPVVNIVETACRQAIQATKTKAVGLLATERTLESGAYQQAMLEYDPAITLYPKASPNLANIVEDGLLKGQEVGQEIKECLLGFEDTEVDTLILGCTHYPLVATEIARHLRQGTHLISPAKALAKEVARIITQTNYLSTTGGYRECYFTSRTHKAFTAMNQLRMKATIKTITI